MATFEVDPIGGTSYTGLIPEAIPKHRCRGEEGARLDRVSGDVIFTKKCYRCRRLMSLGRAKNSPEIRGIDIITGEMLALANGGSAFDSPFAIPKSAVDGWMHQMYLGYALTHRERGYYDAGWLASEVGPDSAPFRMKTLAGIPAPDPYGPDNVWRWTGHSGGSK